jgi:dephospho-CoA kinase
VTGDTPRPVRIGLTGPIGCGKSTVAGWLRARGALVIDADRLARDATAPGEPALDEVLGMFGDGVKAPDGSLDRKALGRIVFADAEALARLEAIVHPAVRRRILAALEQTDEPRVVVIEAIKLVEGGLAELCDEVWLITCDRAVQRTRLVGRGSAPADADQRIAAQGDLAARLAPWATRVIDTSGDTADTRRLVTDAWNAASDTTPSG